MNRDVYLPASNNGDCWFLLLDHVDLVVKESKRLMERECAWGVI